MCSACMTSSPAGSKRAVEQSWRSVMFGEWAERISTAPISSQAARSAPVITWRATGSSPGRSCPHRRDRAGLVDGRAPARGQHQRRLGQLEDARARRRRNRPPARRGARACVTQLAVEARLALALGHAAIPGRPRARLGTRLDGGDPDRDQLEPAPRGRGSRSAPRAGARSPRPAAPGPARPDPGSAARRPDPR